MMMSDERLRAAAQIASLAAFCCTVLGLLAVAAVAASGVRVRSLTDLEEIASDLVLAARQTFEPAHVSLWMRSSESRLR